MSGIVGLFRRDGVEVPSPDFERMIAQVRYRGPDGCSSMHSGPVQLGHALLRINYDRSRHQIPLEKHGTAITFDGRLDNRSELISATNTEIDTSDPALIIAAYEKWDTDCVCHLLGDFAFAIWDSPRRRLFCGRDHFGVKPLYYRVTADTFAFGSSLGSVLASESDASQPDEAWIAGFLAGIVLDHVSTPFNDVRRLAPRHWLSVTPDAFETRSYWHVEPPGSPQKFDPTTLRCLLEEAVRCRLSSPELTASLLSGGLDSSSVACLAAQIRAKASSAPLRTFSLIFEGDPEQGETEHIEAVLDYGRFDPVLVKGYSPRPFEDLPAFIDQQHAPFLAPGLGFSRALHAEAAKHGIRVILDGHGGDEVISHGTGRLFELARKREWLALWRELNGLAKVYGQHPLPTFLRLFVAYGVPAGRVIRGCRTLLGAVRRRFRKNRTVKPSWARLLAPALMDRSGIARLRSELKREESKACLTETSRHAWVIRSPLNTHAFEVLDEAAAQAGVELRFPFWDKRLVEYCLTLPAEAKLSSGWPRLSLRRAMDGVLPATIQWRRDKLDFSPQLLEAMRHTEQRGPERLFAEGAPAIEDFLDLRIAREALNRLSQGPDAPTSDDFNTVWRAASVAYWLQSNRSQANGSAYQKPTTVRS